MRYLIFLFLILAGCTQHKGGGDTKFLLPWRDANGTYRLQEVTIATLSSPYELRGEAAEVYYASGFSDAGFSGPIARPHLMQSGDTYIPMDTESSIAVTVYAQMDKLFLYERRVGSSGQIAWPRHVGVELNLTASDGTAHNNAHYFGTLDVIGLLPFTLGGVSLAINQGVVAHELFHAHFQHEVMNALNTGHGPVVSTLENYFYPSWSAAAAPITPVTTPASLNDWVLRAWNEGLADFFAATYINDPNFFSASMPQIALRRNLAAPTGAFMSQQDFAEKMSNPALGLDIAYVEGTVLARLLFKLAHAGIETPEQFQQRIFLRLRNIASRVQPQLSSQVLNFEAVVPILLEGFSFDAKSCGILRQVMSQGAMAGSFAACS